MGETNFGILAQTSLLKKLCGQDLIGFEFKNKKPFDAYNYSKIIISSNSLPTSTDTSEGFYRRWLILDFPNIFPEGHDILKTIPEAEYNNLAKKVTLILPKLLERGKFTNQGSIEERKAKYIMSSNPLPYFLKKYCIPDNEGFIPYNEFYQEYINYLRINKKRKVSRKEFKAALEDEGYYLERVDKKFGETWKTIYCVEGLRFSDISDISTKILTQIPMGGVKWENLSEMSEISEIHQTCSLCGEEPSHFWLNNGKPVCKSCYQSLKVNKVVTEHEEVK